MEELFVLRERDMDRIRIIRNLIERRLTNAQAAAQLNLSNRQAVRLKKRLLLLGPRGLIHGLRGRPSNHQLEPGLLSRALGWLRQERWTGFRPTYAGEKLAEKGIHLSVTTLRQAMAREGLWRKRPVHPRHRAWRERRPCLGMLTQLDGSDHPWFEDRAPRCVLLLYIDDATGRILWAEFVHVEDTLTLLQATRSYLERFGRPLAFYVDKDSIYRVNRQATIEEDLQDTGPMSQFGRAMKELSIDVIFAHSPQAKGRVERSFKTHQDRLVKELRLRQISTFESANRFLLDVYIPAHNARFAVAPANPSDAHRPLLASHRLDRILSQRTDRVLAGDFTVRFLNRYFQVLPDQRLRPKVTLQVEMRLDGSTHLIFKGRYLRFKSIPKPPLKPLALPKQRPPSRGTSIPRFDHPWRRFHLGRRTSQPHLAYRFISGNSVAQTTQKQ